MRIGRIYARAQGEAKDGHTIDRRYLGRTGLDDLPAMLAEIFHGEYQRRTGDSTPTMAVLNEIMDSSDRLQRQVARELAEKETADAIRRLEAAEKAAQDLIEEEAKEQQAAKPKNKSKSKGKGKNK